ncbi:hypothetical protein BCR39DRAFT_520833 [Naematelia encephala]|uniref:Ion transport domain-containing protein n=1 Tax=Naematelia encephala TaxID=71784 RepID=A0A1Y2BDY2_9TREE|nr:hypothetical protein BCR39DRAFT_520833 [Naematelia encephala]
MALHQMSSGERTPLLGPSSGISSKELSETKVYPLIHLIRVDILTHIDTPLTYDQLLAPDSTYTIVRPLTEKYLEMQNQSIVFCLLLNRVQFTRDSTQLSISTLSVSRATLCEILAIRVLRGWSERSLPLATVLLTPWALFQGASEAVTQRAVEDGDDDILTQGGNALEMAIIGGSKRFIRSPSCQKVIEGIWSGRIIYSAKNAHAIIADNYKNKPIQIYNPHKAPLLDHYRLKVPRVRSILDYVSFLILFILYVVAVEGLDETHLNGKELAFIIYALAYSLDKLATIREHGLKVFSSSLVNGFDLVFMLIYAFYLSARLYGFHYHNDDALSLGADSLAIGAVLIFPRLAFVTLANNLMVLSIRSMLTEFFFLMGIGIFCFLGFLYALFTLGQGKFALSQIGWYLLEVYFGLDAAGFEAAHVFHPFLGPILMVTYALLSNTLLLTVLVAILGNTFSTINADAAAESMFRKAVATIEGVKADAVFSYQMPFNLVAVVFLWPMSYILSPRWFHKLNVWLIRVSNLPVLLAISLYERQQYNETTVLEQLGEFAERYVGNLPRKLKAAAGFDNFGSRADINAVFEIEREVGDYYRLWDDDGFDESEIRLPPPMDENENGDAEGKDQAPEQEPAETPRSAPIAVSPGRIVDDLRDEEEEESPRRRRQSTSSLARPTSPHQRMSVSFAPGLVPPRRNSSMYEPSPLARLFVRSPDQPVLADRMRERRQSLASALVGSSSQPALSSILSPVARGPRRHSRTISQPPNITFTPLAAAAASEPPQRIANPVLQKPSIAPIDEDRRLSFTESFEPKAEEGKSVSVPFPKHRAEGSNTESVGKASEISDPMAEPPIDDIKDRLERIDKRQKRIEDLLEKLLRRKDDDDDNDVFDE